ncbi:MAG: Flp pilus assembly complex ATPase component TadA [Phycisphaeraceae bacterium]|nr:MAG: Flp pilus assembly complex ATPase component TadA [Phycisphaeraceae bacterium]
MPIDATTAPLLPGLISHGTDPALPIVLAQSAFVLVSWWKFLFFFAPLLAWGWLVSKVFDKHAERFHLGRETWGAVHLFIGLIALAAGLAMPIPAWWGFLVGVVAMVVILAIDVMVFTTIANRDERVPEHAHLKLDLSALAEASSKRKAARQAATVSLEIKDSAGKLVAAPEKETPEYEIRVEAEQLLIKALGMRARRLIATARSTEAGSSAEFIIDGVRHPGDTLTPQKAKAIIDFWKGCANLDVKDVRRRLVGKCTIEHEGTKIPVRLLSIGQKGGLRLTMLFNPAQSVTRKVDDLGLSSAQRTALDEIVKAKGGLVLLAAGPMSGRTTSLYSIIQMHDAYTNNVQTIEIEPMAELEGIRQISFDPTAEAEFSTTVRSILRRDPDVVGVAEMPDVETAKEIANADLSRTRMYLSLNIDSALSAIQLWVKAVGDPAKAAKSLNGVVAQKLIRKLCGNCRVPYQPQPDLMKKLQLPTNVQQLFKKGGQVLIKNKPEICPVCKGIGYEDQLGVFEVFPIGSAEQKLIAAQDWTGLRGEMRKRKLPSIQQAALLKAVEGETSMEEVQRIAAPPKKPAPAKNPSGTGS